jgi:hypothetical protein
MAAHTFFGNRKIARKIAQKLLVFCHFGTPPSTCHSVSSACIARAARSGRDRSPPARRVDAPQNTSFSFASHVRVCPHGAALATSLVYSAPFPVALHECRRREADSCSFRVVVPSPVSIAPFADHL